MGRIFDGLDVVVCCNTTELEQEVMKSLVVNCVPTILVVMNRFREKNNVQIQRALAEGRLLIVVMKQSDKNQWSPKDRNDFLINKMSDRIVDGYINKNGSLFPLLAGKKNLKILTDDLVSDLTAEYDKSYQRGQSLPDTQRTGYDDAQQILKSWFWMDIWMV